MRSNNQARVDGIQKSYHTTWLKISQSINERTNNRELNLNGSDCGQITLKSKCWSYEIIEGLKGSGIYIYIYICVCVCVCVTFFSFAFSFLFLECKNGLDSRSINQTKLISLGIYIRYTATYPVIFVLQLNSRQKVTWISCSPLHFSRIGTGNVGEERKCGRGRERLCLRMNGQAVSFEFAKDVGEEGRFRIESKHVTGESIDNGEAAAPEAVSIRFD